MSSCWLMRFFVWVALVASVTGCGDAEAIVQPMPFSHALHVGKNEVACVKCHRGVETASHAGRPGIQVCASCHDVMLGKSEAERRVVEAVEGGHEILWRRLYALNPSVHFSHARHVSVANLECQTCHGTMALQQTPPPSALMALTMDDCIGCHRTNQIRDDCNACHR